LLIDIVEHFLESWCQSGSCIGWLERKGTSIYARAARHEVGTFEAVDEPGHPGVVGAEMGDMLMKAGARMSDGANQH
jgi:hypothetical protein